MTSSRCRSSEPHGISLSSANPYSVIKTPQGNRQERWQLSRTIESTSRKLVARRSFIYNYALTKHYELKFSGIADDIFTRVRERVDDNIGRIIPESIQKFTAVYEGLASENPENWANAVHSCRRILQDLADALFPPTEQSRNRVSNGKQVQIKLGPDQYKNRLIAYVEDSSDSHKFQQIVGSHLGFLGDRLDSVFEAAQKGSHHEIVSKEEADRYVIYTYLLIGDILALRESRSER